MISPWAARTFEEVHSTEQMERSTQRYGTATIAGYKGSDGAKVNQDAAAVGLDHVVVCDGHGQQGHIVSALVAKELSERVGRPDEIFRSGFRETYLAVDEKVAALGSEVERSGSTAVAVLVQDGRLFCANVGDSRAVLGRRMGSGWAAHSLSKDHKPDAPAEKARLKAAGGVVSTPPVGPARIAGLAMSRAFGDFGAKLVGVIAEPDVISVDLSTTHEVVLVATDGVWDAMSQETALALVQPYFDQRDADGAARAVVDAARAIWEEESPTYGDDITCAVMWLQ
jgi:serine/threonine protein phosphatase PrpC